MKIEPSSGVWNFAVGAIIVAFVIFITGRGELATWVGFFLYSPPPTPAPSPRAPSPTPTPPTLWNFLTGHWYDQTPAPAPTPTPQRQ